MSNALVVIPEKPVKEHIDNTEAVAAHRANGGGLFHVRPRRRGNGNWARGFSVAYKVKGSRIEFATSVQHRADVFCKKVGTKVALQHFNEGKTVTLPFKSLKSFSMYLEFAAA